MTRLWLFLVGLTIAGCTSTDAPKAKPQRLSQAITADHAPYVPPQAPNFPAEFVRGLVRSEAVGAVPGASSVTRDGAFSYVILSECLRVELA
jgi:hypothetical protein